MKFNYTDLVGQTYGRLTILKYSHTGKYYAKFFNCLCVCGSKITVRMSHLRNGHTQSCGCIFTENPPNTSHGESRTKLYKVYYAMLERCHVSTSSGYYKYGAKGITVCDDWRTSYEKFREWSKLNGYKPGLGIDRRDNGLGYSPENCRWVTSSINQTNKGKISTNTSGYTGVSFHKTKKKWIARIVVSGVRKDIGRFETANDAYLARKNYIIANNLTEHLRALEYV